MLSISSALRNSTSKLVTLYNGDLDCRFYQKKVSGQKLRRKKIIPETQKQAIIDRKELKRTEIDRNGPNKMETEEEKKFVQG